MAQRRLIPPSHTLPGSADWAENWQPPEARRGRGVVSNDAGRFERLRVHPLDDGWGGLDDTAPPLRTIVTKETSKTIIMRNRSPDIPFEQSINGYKGCEHGCTYCFARPTHAYIGLSPGLDFESRLFFKPDAAELLKRELAHKSYVCTPIAMGTNTDPYQPVEKRLKITRQILEVLYEARHPVTLLTKSALITRDLDILSAMAKRNLVRAGLSINSLDRRLVRAMEPRAATPKRRLEALGTLVEAGVPTIVMVAPVIPGLNASCIENILSEAAKIGVTDAGYILLRLPLEVRDLFFGWLEEVYPDRATRVKNLIRDTRGGKDYDAQWGQRMRGTGPFADMIERRFRLACTRLSLNHKTSGHDTSLDCSQFRAPVLPGSQLDLF